jgi:hypothetical protein
MQAGKDARITSVRITGRHLGRFTATETIGGVVCRITLEQTQDGTYRETDCRPIKSAGDSAGHAN